MKKTTKKKNSPDESPENCDETPHKGVGYMPRRDDMKKQVEFLKEELVSISREMVGRAEYTLKNEETVLASYKNALANIERQLGEYAVHNFPASEENIKFLESRKDYWTGMIDAQKRIVDNAKFELRRSESVLEGAMWMAEKSDNL